MPKPKDMGFMPLASPERTAVGTAAPAEGADLQVPAVEDTGVSSEGLFLRCFDVDDSLEYFVIANSITMIGEPSAETREKYPTVKGLIWARSSSGDGIKFFVSAPPAEIAAAVNRAL